MTWWGWMILGAVLLGAELFAIDAQFYMVFLGLSAALVGLAGMLGIAMPEWVQWTAFGTLSLISFFTFRKGLYEKIRGGAKGFRASITGETITIGEELSAGSETRTQFRGSGWTVRNTGSTAISAGSRAKVVKVDGIKLHVEAE